MLAGKYKIKKSIFLFKEISNFSDDQISGMCKVVQFRPKDIVLNRDDVSSEVFLILDGTVSICDFSSGGKEVTYSEISKGGVFGEFAAIDDAPRSAFVEAKTDVVVARMSAQDFRRLITSDGAFGLSVAKHLVAKIRLLSQRVFEFGALSVRQRLYSEILRLCENATPNDGGTCILVPAPSHYELATRVATHREAVTKELNRLVALGIARLERRSITITDIEKLREEIAKDPL
jgi:CRP-like cAMP-binding protein